MITQYILPQDKQNKVDELNSTLGKLELQCAKEVYENISYEHKIRKEFSKIQQYRCYRKKYQISIQNLQQIY